ncbi:signal peptidase I [Candidatus Roizmanbacteria bacterium CG10_big_fil_rev_8_21_14_0_10_45_7]|uniref:Signal peptidase I n=1 Tax=Candidatus Roizmanbacteria bacterium CG10_big_fil_rev_8_21_14_0_10_45_7 TaxID=1974854 RepID=A0A2M8KVI1_9BACT|nr:MAG: signal peptidase I [Candidatus Roizmanbacteria bacterium CG10_big_fil_rev_8_21_14_0_10_45_7]
MFFLRSLWLLFLDFLETIVVSLAIFAVVYIFLFQPHQVDGQSMEPNFHHREYILTDKISYRIHNPSRGDVIVFHSPQDERVDFIKRIIGIPGDLINISGGHVYLNGTQLLEQYINNPGHVLPGKFLHEGAEIEVPTSQYFVMGDNRNHSSDSREWGLITAGEIVGRAFFRYWPLSEFGLVPTAEDELTMGSVKGAIAR